MYLARESENSSNFYFRGELSFFFSAAAAYTSS
jgi:hypothetical protein